MRHAPLLAAHFCLNTMPKKLPTSPATPLPEIKENRQEPPANDETLQEKMWWVPDGVYSFGDLLATERAYEAAEMMELRTNQLHQILSSIFRSPFLQNKATMVEALFAEYLELARKMFDGEMTDADPIETAAERFSEAGGDIVDVEMIEGAGNDAPLYLDVAIIRPGWGNTRDNFYYSREMLRKYAENFVGAKMYETDHREEEKSTRTWVSTVKEIKGYREDGAPIARVAIHDPDFAQRARNLKETGVLTKLECSILASGKARPNFEQDGRKGRFVETIDRVSAVDWVTRAGAGGHAIDIAENDTNGEIMPKEITPPKNQNAPVITQEDAAPPKSEPEQVNMQEQDASPVPPVFLSESQVSLTLGVVGLPEASVERLQGRQYASLQELTQAITAEKEYVGKLTGAGKVFGMGETSIPEPTPSPVIMTEVAQVHRRIDARYQ